MISGRGDGARARLMVTRVVGVILLIAVAMARPAHAGDEYGRVELIRDRWGVAHVFSDTDAGAMYGLGYACAQDRAFQMYYSLRIIQGRLAEVVGDRPSSRRNESAVFNDRKMRTFGFYRAAQEAAKTLDAETRALLTAYCAGVNDYVNANREKLHPLFGETGLDPEAWTPADCIASFWRLGQFFGTDGTRELIHFRNTANAPGRGPGANWADDDAAVVQRADVPDEWVERVERFMKENNLLSAAPGLRETEPKFSHAWVVGGAMTATGAAVLVSDPQTPVRFPSIWHEFHVCGKTFNARGIGVAGCPGLLIGWNEHVAWGATALGADQADLFRLKTDDGHPDQYSVDDVWRQMDVRRETIKVKGGDAVELVVRETMFGPIVTDFAFATPGDPQVALKRVPVCTRDTGTLRAMLAMMRAKDARDFGAAVASWEFPSINIVFGDRNGAIGYWMLAAIPVRAPGHDGSAALDGSVSDYDWRGFVPHDLLPHVFNPARGWIASANHRAVASFYKIPMGVSTGGAGHTIRSWRLYELLGARGSNKMEPREVLDIHYDTVNPARREIVALGLHLTDVLGRELSRDATAALDRLDGWLKAGAHSDLDHEGAELAMEINTFFRLTATPLAVAYGGGESGLSRCLRELSGRIATDPLADLSAEEQEFIDNTLAGAWRSARGKYGDDPARWNERARRAVGAARIGAFASLDGFGSLDPEADLFTPSLACVDGSTIKSQAGQSYTQYVPLHDVDQALSLLPPGQSEHGDASAMELWARGELHPAALSRAGVERVTAERVVLRP